MDLKEYEKIWTDKVIQADRNFASMHLMDNVVSKDDPLIGQFVSKPMSGGTRVRQYPIHATNELAGHIYRMFYIIDKKYSILLKQFDDIIKPQ